MKISIKNFKSIGLLDNFEIKPLTILSGTNSSGKSSFIQLLLILKQTLEAASTQQPLVIKGDLYSANSFLDLVKGKNPSLKIQVKFTIQKSEFAFLGELVKESIFDGFPDYECDCSVSFCIIKNEIEISDFEISYLTEVKKEFLILRTNATDSKISIDTNTDYFLKQDYLNDENSIFETQTLLINYVAFIPNTLEVIGKRVKKEILDDEGKLATIDEKHLLDINIDSLRSFIENYFFGMYYIGPLRIEPQDNYPDNPSATWVGIKGEDTAQILEKLKDEPIECNIPQIDGDFMRFKLDTIPLIEATNIWMCQIFKIARKIFPKKVGENYSISLENDSGIETTIKHVGFGISQVLPIIVQGLLMKKGETLVLEQPEIHLHPKIQSYLFDFLNSLILQGKKVIVESHSDHMITRLRRRIAEDEGLGLDKVINLSFIEQIDSDLKFDPIKLDEFGVYNVFPENFIENPEKELRALLNAQLKKRKAQRI